MRPLQPLGAVRGQQHDPVLDGVDGRDLVGVAAVAQHLKVPARHAQAAVVAPVGEGLEQLAELVEVGAHLHARQRVLLVEHPQVLAALQRVEEDVAHVLARARHVQVLDVAQQLQGSSAGRCCRGRRRPRPARPPSRAATPTRAWSVAWQCDTSASRPRLLTRHAGMSRQRSSACVSAGSSMAASRASRSLISGCAK